MKVSANINEHGFSITFDGRWITVQALIKAVVATALTLAAGYEVLAQTPVLVPWLSR